ncbi:MAG: hypothetical protein J1D88_07335 [Treponema sp.]|nr:hypothetical protein [Treponema sp.]
MTDMRTVRTERTVTVLYDDLDTKINPYDSRSTGRDDNESSIFRKNLCTVRDSNYYYCDKAVFRPEYVASQVIIKAPIIMTICIIGGFSTVSRNQNVRETAAFYLMITYQPIWQW